VGGSETQDVLFCLFILEKDMVIFGLMPWIALLASFDTIVIRLRVLFETQIWKEDAVNANHTVLQVPSQLSDSLALSIST